jgi:hypothetical protein
MRIQFFLNNEEETEITSFHDYTSNPFKEGDVISLYVDELVPRDLDIFKRESKIQFNSDNLLLKEKFHLKKIRLIKERKYLNFTNLSQPKLIIEYHCEIIDKDNEISETTHSTIGSYHWFHSLLATSSHIGEFLKDKTPEEDTLKIWG